jgi:hypothetical protein
VIETALMLMRTDMFTNSDFNEEVYVRLFENILNKNIKIEIFKSYMENRNLETSQLKNLVDLSKFIRVWIGVRTMAVISTNFINTTNVEEPILNKMLNEGTLYCKSFVDLDKSIYEWSCMRTRERLPANSFSNTTIDKIFILNKMLKNKVLEKVLDKSTLRCRRKTLQTKFDVIMGDLYYNHKDYRDRYNNILEKYSYRGLKLIVEECFKIIFEFKDNSFNALTPLIIEIESALTNKVCDNTPYKQIG